MCMRVHHVREDVWDGGQTPRWWRLSVSSRFALDPGFEHAQADLTLVTCFWRESDVKDRPSGRHETA